MNYQFPETGSHILASETFRVGEIITTLGGPYNELRVADFVEDSVKLADGRTLHRIRVSLNGRDGDGRTIDSFEVELFDLRGPLVGSGSAYLREKIGDLVDARQTWQELPLARQEAAQNAFWEAVKQADNPTLSGLGDATLCLPYLRNQENRRIFHQAQATAANPVEL